MTTKTCSKCNMRPAFSPDGLCMACAKEAAATPSVADMNWGKPTRVKDNDMPAGNVDDAIARLKAELIKVKQAARELLDDFSLSPNGMMIGTGKYELNERVELSEDLGKLAWALWQMVKDSE